MVIAKREDVTKQGFCQILSRKLRLRGSPSLIRTYSIFRGWVGGGRFIEFEWDQEGGGVGWAHIRGWALINFFCL